VTHRLLVTLDAALKTAKPMLGGVDGVSAVRQVDGADGMQRYALDTADPLPAGSTTGSTAKTPSMSWSWPPTIPAPTPTSGPTRTTC